MQIPLGNSGKFPVTNGKAFSGISGKKENLARYTDIRLRAISLFLENRGEERKTSKHASVTVSVTYERRCREPLVTRASEDEAASLLARQAYSPARTLSCFAFFPTDFRGKERLLAVYTFSELS